MQHTAFIVLNFAAGTAHSRSVLDDEIRIRQRAFLRICLDTARHFLGEGLDEGHPGRKGDDGELDLKRDRGGGFRRQLLSASFRAIATKTYPAKKEGNTVCLTN